MVVENDGRRGRDRGERRMKEGEEREEREGGVVFGNYHEASNGCLNMRCWVKRLR